MKFPSFIYYSLSLVLIGLALFGINQWLAEHETYRPVEIMAPRDVPDLALPVYAQFVVTQTLALSDTISATHLILPMYTPAKGGPLVVTFKRNGKTVKIWDFTTAADDTATEYDLAFDPPELLDGDIEIEIAAREIDHEAKDLAPRLFTETADNNYPDGNYRIAENEKAGDVALTIVAQRQRGDRLWQEWKNKPLRAVEQIGYALLGLMIVGALPWVPQRLWQLRFEKSD